MTRRTPATTTVSYPRQSPARRTRCPGCRRWTLAGLDGSVCALLTVVDPVALDPVGEMVALLAGCRTVSLGRDGRLQRRGAREIAAGQPLPVLAIHRCDRTNTGTPLDGKPAAPLIEVPPIHEPGDPPPF
jgi:hypothetical protein